MREGREEMSYVTVIYLALPSLSSLTRKISGLRVLLLNFPHYQVYEKTNPVI